MKSELATIEPEISVSNGWDIYPSCDVKLGKFFNDHPEYPDAYIDIDTEAIKSIISRLSLETTPDSELRFEVAPLKDSEMLEKGRLGYYLEKPKPKKSKNADEIKDSNSNIPKCVVGVDVDKGIESFGRLYTIKDQELHFPADSVEEQAVAVHELRHAVDYIEPDLLAEQQRFTRNTAVKSGSLTGLGVFAVWEAAHIVGTEPISEALNTNEYAVMATLGIAAIGAYFKVTLPKLTNHLHTRMKIDSPMEQRAYADMGQAHQYPTAIRLYTD